jgi:hypothetical protein
MKLGISSNYDGHIEINLSHLFEMAWSSGRVNQCWLHVVLGLRSTTQTKMPISCNLQKKYEEDKKYSSLILMG